MRNHTYQRFNLRANGTRPRIANCELRIAKLGTRPKGGSPQDNLKARSQETAGRDGDAAKTICERLSRRFSGSPLLLVIPLCLRPRGPQGRLSNLQLYAQIKKAGITRHHAQKQSVVSRDSVPWPSIMPSEKPSEGSPLPGVYGRCW